MKLNTIIYLFLIFFSDQTKNIKIKFSEIDDMKIKWINLFGTEDRSSVSCNMNINKQMIDSNKKTEIINYLYPMPKNNPFSSHHGLRSSAYLFDYLDEIIKNPILNYFENLYNSAIGLKPDDTYDNPYTIEKMITLISFNKGNIMTPATSEEGKYEQMKRLNPSFSSEIYSRAISGNVISSILRNWNWHYPKVKDYIKTIIDTYDFDGDGRLNAYEFLLWSILNSSHFLITTHSTNVYKEIFSEYIDPIFKFLDCDDDDYINSEQIWEGLKKLKKSKSYNIYKCILPNLRNNEIRTDSCNDFILINQKKFKAMINIFEFRNGILLGYLNRHVKDNKIYNDDSLSKKNDRWNENGLIDINCEDILRWVK